MLSNFWRSGSNGNGANGVNGDATSRARQNGHGVVVSMKLNGSVNGHGNGINNDGAPLVQLKDVSKAYQTPAGDFWALQQVDLQIKEGEFVALVGKSGAGKSTLVNMITGIDKPTAGEVFVGNTAVHKMSEAKVAGWRGQNVGVVFQFFQLLPRITCVQNVMLPMDFAGLYESNRQRRERAMALLEQVGIADHADKLPSAVSGGQRQRVAIARALANDPPILVADEPTGNLDSKTAREVMDVFESLVEGGKTILMVTHDRELAGRTTRTVQIADGLITPPIQKALNGTTVNGRANGSVITRVGQDYV